jgi:hypothetical protein
LWRGRRCGEEEEAMAEGERVMIVKLVLLLLLVVVVEEEEEEEDGNSSKGSKGRVASVSMDFFAFTRCSSKEGGPTRCGVS